MIDFNNMAKLLIMFGLILLFMGLFLLVLGKMPFFGKMPGDIYIKRGNFVFYFPIVTSILISIILTIVLNLLLRGHK